MNQDYDKLLAYSRELNEVLHAKKIKESQRSLLISGILIALQSKAFEASYTKFSTAKQLAANLVSTILDELSGSDLKLRQKGHHRARFWLYKNARYAFPG